MTDGNTRRSFRDKWEQNPRLAFDQTLQEGSDLFQWILSRNGFPSPEALRDHLAGRRRILDAGCGNGRITALLRRYSDPAHTEIVGIDVVSADVARENLAGAPNVRIHAKDLRGDLSELGTFDFIYCQEVLHHTGDARGAFLNLRSLLAPGGELAIYVYKRKAPLREYADDFVRERIAALPYEQAIAASAQLAEFGRALSALATVVRVPAVDVLEIPAGEYDVQRLVYHFFLKCFWSDELSPRENAVVNYDWYHPQDCTRHTREEVRGWFHDAGLDIVHECVDPYGITAWGRTP